jgi:hypothetical protein
MPPDGAVLYSETLIYIRLHCVTSLGTVTLYTDFSVNTQFSSTQRHKLYSPPEPSIETFYILEVLLCTLSLIPSFHLLTGLPHLLFLCGFHSATCLATLQSSIRMTWSRHLNCSSSISYNMSFFIPILALIVSFLNLSFFYLFIYFANLQST